MKVTVKGYIYWHKYSWADAASFIFFGTDSMGDIDPNYALIQPHQFDVEIPDDFNPVPQQIQAMRTAQTAIRAKAEAQVTNIEESIQRLLCIEYKPGTV